MTPQQVVVSHPTSNREAEQEVPHKPMAKTPSPVPRSGKHTPTQVNMLFLINWNHLLVRYLVKRKIEKNVVLLKGQLFNFLISLGRILCYIQKHSKKSRAQPLPIPSRHIFKIYHSNYSVLRSVIDWYWAMPKKL